MATEEQKKILANMLLKAFCADCDKAGKLLNIKKWLKQNGKQYADLAKKSERDLHEWLQ